MISNLDHFLNIVVVVDFLLDKIVVVVFVEMDSKADKMAVVESMPERHKKLGSRDKHYFHTAAAGEDIWMIFN